MRGGRWAKELRGACTLLRLRYGKDLFGGGELARVGS